MRDLWQRAWMAFRAWRTWRAGVRIEWCVDCDAMLTDADPRCEECRVTYYAKQQAVVIGSRDNYLAMLQGFGAQATNDPRVLNQQQAAMQNASPYLGALGNAQHGGGLGNIFRGLM